MRNTVLPVGMAMLLLLGCSDDKGMESKTAAPAAPAAAKPMADADMGPADSALGSGVIDHTRDRQEFVLRRGLWGVEALIEQYKAAGDDASALKAQKAELEQQLKALLG